MPERRFGFVLDHERFLSRTGLDLQWLAATRYERLLVSECKRSAKVAMDSAKLASNVLDLARRQAAQAQQFNQMILYILAVSLLRR